MVGYAELQFEKGSQWKEGSGKYKNEEMVNSYGLRCR